MFLWSRLDSHFVFLHLVVWQTLSKATYKVTLKQLGFQCFATNTTADPTLGTTVGG